MYQRQRGRGAAKPSPAPYESRTRDRTVQVDATPGNYGDELRERYRLPDPVRSAEQYDRFYHRDVEIMSPEEVWAEHAACKDALGDLVRDGREVYIMRPDGFPTAGTAWLRERIAATLAREP